MTSPLLLDQLAAQHRSDLIAEIRRPLPRTTEPLTARTRRALLSLRTALVASSPRTSSSRAGRVCCA